MFTAALTDRISMLMAERHRHEPAQRFQRRLMPGGTCEATTFAAFGHSSTCLCLPLGNYHNMVDIDGVAAGTGEAKLGPEEISLSDFDGLVALMLTAASDIDDSDSGIRDRLAAGFADRSSLLGL